MAKHVREAGVIRARTLDLLEAQDGKLWKQVVGEWHDAEMPHFVLLRHQTELALAHGFMRSVLQPYMDFVQFTVAYYEEVDGELFSLVFLGSNKEIAEADLTAPGLIKRWRVTTSPFRGN